MVGKKNSPIVIFFIFIADISRFLKRDWLDYKPKRLNKLPEIRNYYTQPKMNSRGKYKIHFSKYFTSYLDGPTPPNDVRDILPQYPVI